jgi:hypothetical protein
MRLLGPLGGEFGAGDEEDGEGDEHHEERASNGHSGEFGGDRAEGEYVEQVFHYHSSGACRMSFRGKERFSFLPFRLREDSGYLVN